MKVKKLLVLSLSLIFACGMCAACGNDDSEDKTAADSAGSAASANEIHVSIDGSDSQGDGSAENPYATMKAAIASIGPGTTIYLHDGEYEPFELDKGASGTADAPVLITAAEGEHAIINGKTPDSDGEDIYDIYLENVSNITIEGLELQAGTHGIAYFSNTDSGDGPLENITISNCTVHGVRGTHGICVYAGNPKTPVKNFVMKDCEVYDCQCGSSESTVVNGNVDGFEIYGNTIHDNNNIGIDMIGFEGTAEDKDSDGNPFAADFARNGKCHDNVVYNISAEGNDAYLEDGEYDLCADGIYVDGGQDIEIYNNYVYNCDIGIEVATEHSPEDNELFKVSGIKVHDNVIEGCTGWCGLAVGGYDRDLGFTEDCEFTNNTFIDNDTQIGIQRCTGNKFESNLFVGGGSAIEFNLDCREEDMVNELGENTWCVEADDLKEMIDFGDFDLEKLLPGGALEKQTVTSDKDSVIEGWASKVKGVGSSFVPKENAIPDHE